MDASNNQLVAQGGTTVGEWLQISDFFTHAAVVFNFSIYFLLPLILLIVGFLQKCLVCISIRGLVLLTRVGHQRGDAVSKWGSFSWI